MDIISPLFGTRLTLREKQISSLIAQGFSSKKIADMLTISEYTVANHRKSIIKKKGVKSLKGEIAF